MIVTLYGCKKITDENISELRAFKNLRKLNLSLTNIKGITLNSLPKLIELINLSFCKNLLDESITKLELKLFENLHELNISETNINEITIDSLPKSLITGCNSK